MVVKIQISKSSGKVTHIDKSGKKTVVTGLPPQANNKAIEARLKAMGLGLK